MTLQPLVAFDMNEVTPIDKLNDRHRIFVFEYLKDLNATRAARSAGYNGEYLGQIGYNLLNTPDVKAAILYEQTRRLARHEAASHRIIQELCGIAFANLADFYTVGLDGDPQLDLSNLTREQWATISEISVDYYTEGRGDMAREVKRVKLKQHPKNPAIDTLIKLLGLNPADRLDLTVNGAPTEIAEDVDPRTAADLYRKMRDKQQ